MPDNKRDSDEAPPALPALVCCIVAGSVYDLVATFDPAGLWALTAARRKEALAPPLLGELAQERHR